MPWFLLLKLPSLNIDRPRLVTVANLFRRVGLNDQGIKLLNPIVRSNSKNYIQPTQLELTEYGALLINLGVYHEGLAVLNLVDSSQVPSALLYKAFGFFNQWDYEKARPILEEYIRQPSLTEYQRQIGNLNLLAAYVETSNFQLFDEGFASISEYLTKNDYKLLLGNLFEIKSQRHFFEGDLKEAKKSLQASFQYLQQAEVSTVFLIKKWDYIFNLNAISANDENLYNKLCHEAISEGFSEGIRDLDLYRFSKTKNNQGLKYLYWGTPFAIYRKKITRFSGQSYKPSDTYIWMPSKVGFANNDFDSIKNMKIVNPIEDLTLLACPLLMKLFYVLTQDFYRQLKSAELHSLIFPENFYNPNSSPEVIKQLVFRLKKVLIKNKWPLKLTVNSGRYSLKPKKLYKNNFAFKLCFLDRTENEIEKQIVMQRLNLFKLKKIDYTYGELRRNSQKCETSFGIDIKKALELGLLSKAGHNKSTRYRLLISST